MDEHIYVAHGRVVTFSGGFADHNLNNLTWFVEKHNKYATREAVQIILEKLKGYENTKSITLRGSSFQAYFKRFLKTKSVIFMPYTHSALLYFVYRYIFQLGFLDGREGLIYHFLQGYWYRFLVGAKLVELDMALSEIADRRQTIMELSNLTGLKIEER